jgi:hypothetical protein
MRSFEARGEASPADKLPYATPYLNDVAVVSILLNLKDEL